MKKTTRIEKDTLGEVEVPSESYFGAQTARSLHFFAIGQHPMPMPLIYAFVIIKKAAAQVNADLNLIPKDIQKSIVKATDEILKGGWDLEFPLTVWQTGSGTQTNMNINEVIANRASEMMGYPKGKKFPVHPNDHVNLSQSSNDTFPTAMHIAAVQQIHQKLLPALEVLQKALEKKEKEFSDIVKIGRTHLMDAVPLTLGQEFSGYVSQIKQSIKRIKATLPDLLELAIGATAVGTGLNAHPEFQKRVVAKINEMTGFSFKPAPNLFAALSSHEAFVFASGALKALSCALIKIANDIRWMGSGPRAGLAELLLPENEPGSSIMPGKVNPTQSEALTMIATQVIGNDTAITMADSQGNFELNVFKPVIIYNFLQSIMILSDGCQSFAQHMVNGLKANKKQIKKYVDHSLMTATILNPLLGYDKTAQVVRKALLEDKSLKEVILELKFLSEKEFDRLVDPKKMIFPSKSKK